MFRAGARRAGAKNRFDNSLSTSVKPGLSLLLGAGFAIAIMTSWSPAHAVPSFARQTGLQCNVCHTAYPELTPFGREFKMNSYSFTGGNPKFPPIAALVQGSFTQTTKDQPGVKPHFGDNNNFAVQQTSLFYGGRIWNRLGAFAQVTYDGVDRRLAIDNTDIRYSHDTQLMGKDFLFGFTLNNNPTVQDPWNTTPAWGYPFSDSGDLYPGAAAATFLNSDIGGQVAGLGGYVHWNNMIYAEFTGYYNLSQRTQTALGISPEGQAEIKGMAPYWRLALEHSWGNSYFSGGTFGMIANTYPGRDSTKGTDRRVDVGLDAQYQYLTQKHNVGIYLRWIHEKADWNASQQLGDATNLRDSLSSFNATVSYLYDQTYGADLNFFNISGGADTALYGGDSVRNSKPDTQSIALQADYLPFNKNGGPSFWPWFNPKLIARYTWFTKYNGATTNYDGAGRNASDNNIFYAMVWLPF